MYKRQPLADPHKLTGRYFFLFIAIINAVAALFAFIASRVELIDYALLLCLLFAILAIALYFIKHQINLTAYSLMASGLFWLICGVYFPGLLVVLFGIATLYFFSEKELVISEDQLLIKGFITKKIPWSQVAHAQVGHGMLSVNFTNNRLLQIPVNDEETCYTDLKVLLEKKMMSAGY